MHCLASRLCLLFGHCSDPFSAFSSSPEHLSIRRSDGNSSNNNDGRIQPSLVMNSGTCKIHESCTYSQGLRKSRKKRKAQFFSFTFGSVTQHVVSSFISLAICPARGSLF